ncbi:ABC transporter permease subunit [Cohnella sp. CFH 77786]|uniref:nickel transporter permease n=1 Tax=Cohnella sp. CFH 77786 TaxID=2662265 RepID=UPI001C60DFD0|nr:nickel transporter permease [Cohnella sp. CFH 77786]MBW5446379.1 ABC transporter permease subunit [Cohnella sp. CFH 77786]
MNAAIKKAVLRPARNGRYVWLSANPLLLIGISLLFVFMLLALSGWLLAANDPLAVNMAERLKSPSLEYPLGTDHMGRCIFSRLISGARTTLGITAMVLMTVMVIGIPMGLLCGYAGGRIDALFMRLVDGLLALPEFILAIAVAGFLGPSLMNLMLSVVLVKWIGYARVVRGVVMAEREKEYILAARVGGARTFKLLFRHLLPQAVSPVMVLAAFDVGKVILTISSLSYLGLGAQPPAPEWGAMLNDGRPYFQTAPELMLYPGAAIMLVVLAFNLIGDGLRNVLDLKERWRGNPG